MAWMLHNADRIRQRANESDDDDDDDDEHLQVDSFRRHQIRRFLRGRNIRAFPRGTHNEVQQIPANLEEIIHAAVLAIDVGQLDNASSEIHVVAESIILLFDRVPKVNRPGPDVLFDRIFHDLARPLLKDRPNERLVRDLREYCLANAVFLDQLLTRNKDGVTIQQIALHHFEQLFVSDGEGTKVRKFYQQHSILVMSMQLSCITIKRFVTPGPAILGGTTTESVHGLIECDRANFVSGWCGVGKTTFATLPKSLASRKTICIVFTPDEVIKHREDFNTLEKNPYLRDDVAMILMVLATMNAFGIRDTCGINTNIDEPLQGKILKDGSRVPDHETILTREQITGLQQRLGVTTTLSSNDFDVRLVLDEAGGHPILSRSFSRIWQHALRFLMAKILNVKAKRLFLYIVGTGTGNFSQLALDSLPDGYSVTKVSSSLLFPRMLQHAIVCETMFNQRFLKLLFDQMYTREQDAIKVRAATHDSRCFTQLVSDNARCAALAMQQISKKTYANKFFDDRNKFERESHSPSRPFCEKISSLLDTWTMNVCYDFLHLNALGDENDPFDEIGKALLIVLTWRSSLTSDEHSTLVVRFGLLFDTATIKAGSTEVCWDPNLPRYRVSQSIAQMYLFRNRFGSFPRGAVDVDFEHIVADHHVFCLMLGIPNDCPRVALPAVSMFKGIKLWGTIHRVVLSKQLTDGVDDELAKRINDGDALPTKSDAFKTLEQEMEPLWTNMIKAKGAVVIVNGPRAPFADVIVITAERLFLVQVKHYKQAHEFSPAKATEEFDKMLTSPKNIYTRKMLLRCCGNPNAKVVAVVFILSADSLAPTCQDSRDQVVERVWNKNVNPVAEEAVHEKFRCDKILIPSFGSLQMIKVGNALNVGPSQDGTNSALYPMLTSDLIESHLKMWAEPTVLQDTAFEPHRF